VAELRKVGVVGTGPMAAGIAQLCVQSGLEALLLGDSLDALGWAEDAVLRGLERAEQPAAFSLLRTATDLGRLRDCDFVIESAADGLEAKKALLRQLDACLPAGCAIGAQSAVLPIGLFAAAVENPDRVVGVRFFPPVPSSRLMELARGAGSSDAAVASAAALAERLGKEVLRVKDSPGFAAARLSRPFYLAAMRLLERGAGTPATIDEALRAKMGVRFGPFVLADAAGLEEELSVSASIYDLLARPERLKPCAIQEKLLARGCRGRKNSRGFYLYGDNAPGTVNPLLGELLPAMGSRPAPAEEIFRAVLGAIVAEAKTMAEEGIASVGGIDAAARLALGWPRGPFEWAQSLEGG